MSRNRWLRGHGGRGGAAWRCAFAATGLLSLSACGGTVRGGEVDGDEVDGGGTAGDFSNGGSPGDDPVGAGGATKPRPGGAGGWPSAGGAVSAGGAPIPYLCGDGAVNDAEQCDGEDFGGHTCASATMNALPVGTLGCSPDCRLVLIGCGSPGAGGASGVGGSPNAYLCEPVDPGMPTIDPAVFPPCGSYQGGPSMGRCVPAVLVPPPLLTPQDVCAPGELCMAESRVRTAGLGCFERCSSTLGGEGACVPSYLVEAQMAGVVDVLGRVTCQEGETCTPCVSPLDNTRTGACD